MTDDDQILGAYAFLAGMLLGGADGWQITLGCIPGLYIFGAACVRVLKEQLDVWKEFNE